MNYSMGFEVMNSVNPELSWKTATKGRRTRKVIVRSMNSVAKVVNSPSPRSVGDFSGSDSYKFGEAVTGRSTSDKSESVPIKKRRHLLQPPLPHTWTPSFGLSQQQHNDAGDFSGIELLAAAASMHEDVDDAKYRDNVVVDSLISKSFDASSSATDSKLGLKSGESESLLSTMTVSGGNTDCLPVLRNSVTVFHNLCVEPVDVTVRKVNRQHWDLNALMDTWDKQYNDSIAGNLSNDDMHVEDTKKDSSDTATEVSYQSTEKDAGEVSPDQALSSDTKMNTSDQLMNKNAVVHSPPVSKVCWPSGASVSEEKICTISVNVAVKQDGDCSGTVSESERTTSSVIESVSQDTIAHQMPGCEISKMAIDVQCKDIKESWKACEPPGAIIQDGQSVLTPDSRIVSDGTFVPHYVKADSQGNVEPDELVAKHEGNNLPNERSGRITLEEPCKSSIAQPQCCGDPISSARKIGPSIEAQHEPDVSQNHNFHAVGGVDSTKYQGGYDSPHEDGELRGSFLYSWEENELVNYESDGRNGDGSDAADCHHSVTVEGDCQGSHSTQRRNLISKQVHKGSGSKSGSAKQNLSMDFVKDCSGNNEVAGKGSTAGSGTTVEEPMEANIDDIVKRRHLTDRRDMSHMYEHAPKTVGGQSRIEGWSSLDETDSKDAVMQECRCLIFSDGERDGVHRMVSWGSQRSFHRSKGCSYTRPRNIAVDSNKIGGLGFNNPRQMTNYLLKGNRPFVRSPQERDGYFGMRRRGTGNYRSRVHYFHCAGRDFVEDFEPVPDEVNIPVQLSGHLSTKGRSNSPNSGRSAHIPLPCKGSHSKSRTCSAGQWHSHREQTLNTRRHSRSPDFRSEARMERKRVPFPKPYFTSDFGEGYMSPTRGCVTTPLQRNYRWVGDGTFPNNHSGYKRSPVKVFGRTQRCDAVGSSGRLKSDEYLRPMFRPGIFSFMTSGGRECKLVSDYDNKRCEHRNEMMHRGPNRNDNRNVRHFSVHYS